MHPSTPKQADACVLFSSYLTSYPNKNLIHSFPTAHNSSYAVHVIILLNTSSHIHRSICYSVFTSVFAATAFLLSWAAAFGCSFLSFTSTSGFTRPVTVQFGIWSYQFWTVATSVGGSVLFETCHRYPSDMEVDSYVKSARAFSTREYTA